MHYDTLYVEEFVMKKLLIVVFVLFLVSCGGSENNDPTELFEMTPSELEVYDGKNGRKAYIAVDGFIYDVTNSDYWNNGVHNGYQAGQDLSDEMNASPHGTSFLERIPKVGILLDEPVASMLQVIASIPGYESLASLIYSDQISIDFSTFEEVTLFLPSLEGFLDTSFEIPDGFDPSDGFDGLTGDLDLFDILRYHMVSQTLLEEVLSSGMTEVESVQGDMLMIRTEEDVIYINDIPLTETDYIAENGAVHVLDGVLIPPSLDTTVQITFEGLNGDVILIMNYEIGDALVFPTPLVYGGYTFVGWDNEDVTGFDDITIVANYEKIYMTLEDLSAYDGLDGQKAYIAVDGVIYDVTNSTRWNEGAHNGYQAGQDLTDEILGVSPHGVNVLENIPIVAFLSED